MDKVRKKENKFKFPFIEVAPEESTNPVDGMVWQYFRLNTACHHASQYREREEITVNAYLFSVLFKIK